MDSRYEEIMLLRIVHTVMKIRQRIAITVQRDRLVSLFFLSLSFKLSISRAGSLALCEECADTSKTNCYDRDG